ncbi:MAG TPA: hypothetical protein VME21_15185 [Steroidobacteraceae bacterium]|nr:hypothetical protein [Steroidobacteraceae bacterium]
MRPYRLFALALPLLASAPTTPAQQAIEPVPLSPTVKQPARAAAPSPAAQAWVHRHLGTWPLGTQKVAADLITEYGPPAGSTSRELLWYDNGPWKRTVLHKTGPQHNFPLPHLDILEQTVNYRVPPEKVPDLLNYDGSIVVDRTRGELSVHCDSEQQNILTLNLANDILTGERTVDQALAYHAQVIRGLQTHDTESYPFALRFKPQPSSATADPGEEAELLRHLGSPQ